MDVGDDLRNFLLAERGISIDNCRARKSSSQDTRSLQSSKSKLFTDPIRVQLTSIFQQVRSV